MYIALLGQFYISIYQCLRPILFLQIYFFLLVSNSLKKQFQKKSFILKTSNKKKYIDNIYIDHN